MSKKEDQVVSTISSTEPEYTRAQFLSSGRYTPAQRDILAAVLEDGKTYTDVQAKQALETYLGKELK